MTFTVEQAQRKLKGLIALAMKGEEVLIVQEGEPIAKLVPMIKSPVPADRTKWLSSLRELRAQTSAGGTGASIEEILTENRENIR